MTIFNPITNVLFLRAVCVKKCRKHIYRSNPKYGLIAKRAIFG